MWFPRNNIRNGNTSKKGKKREIIWYWFFRPLWLPLCNAVLLSEVLSWEMQQLPLSRTNHTRAVHGAGESGKRGGVREGGREGGREGVSRGGRGPGSLSSQQVFHWSSMTLDFHWWAWLQGRQATTHYPEVRLVLLECWGLHFLFAWVLCMSLLILPLMMTAPRGNT